MAEENAERVACHLGVSLETLRKTCQRARKTGGVSTLELIGQGAEPGKFAEHLTVGGETYEPVEWKNYADTGEDRLVKKRVPVAYAKRGEVLE